MFYGKWQQLGNSTGILQLEIQLDHLTNFDSIVNGRAITDPLIWIRILRISNPMWSLFQKGFTRSKIRSWICRKEREIRFKIENPFFGFTERNTPLLWMAMYRCSIRERLTEKLHNCNGFLTTQGYPPFLKFRQRQNIFVQFPTATWSIKRQSP